MTDQITTSLQDPGFAHLTAAQMLELLRPLGFEDWESFAQSWNDLGLDMFMADGGRYRKRRFAAFSQNSETGALTRKPHQPHYQSRDYNALNGGIARWFLPVLPQIGEHPALAAVLTLANRIFSGATLDSLRPRAWHVELHQFRIETGPGIEGHPTPEGMHRDGVDFVLVLLVKRQNVASGVTSIHDNSRALIGSFILEEPLESALVDDSKVFHGVTPVQPIDPAQPAYRDVLVATYRRE